MLVAQVSDLLKILFYAWATDSNFAILNTMAWETIEAHIPYSSSFVFESSCAKAIHQVRLYSCAYVCIKLYG